MNDSTQLNSPNQENWFRLILKDPLFHFVILGALLFSTYQLVSDDVEASDPQHIVINQGLVKRLAGSFERSWLRQPTKTELNGLIQEHLKEEILYREALALGLDKDDPVIRRRLRQKMEFLNQDISDPPKASDDVLQQYLDKHQDTFRLPPRVSFSQMFFREDGVKGRMRAEAALVKFRSHSLSEIDLEAHGDPTLLPARMQDASPASIAKTFGQEFSKELFSLPLNQWVGPIESGFGLHLLYIDSLVPSEAAVLDDVRKNVAREWLSEQRQLTNDRFFQILRDRYVVEISDAPGDAIASKATGP